MTEEMTFRLVGPGAEAARVVAAYGRSVVLGARVRELLLAVGLDAEAVLVVPGLTESGEPVVWLTPLTSRAGLRLAQILGGGVGRFGCGPAPPPDDSGGHYPVG